MVLDSFCCGWLLPESVIIVYTHVQSFPKLQHVVCNTCMCMKNAVPLVESGRDSRFLTQQTDLCEASSEQLLWSRMVSRAPDASQPWHVCIAWQTDLTLFSTAWHRDDHFHDAFARCNPQQNYSLSPFPSPPSSLSFLSSSEAFVFAFLAAFTFFFYLAAAFSKDWFLSSIKRQGFIHSCISN